MTENNTLPPTDNAGLPEDPPLGNSYPLLVPTSLGQSFLQPKFIYPLGAISLIHPDHLQLESDFEPLGESFNNSPFFDSPLQPTPVETVSQINQPNLQTKSISQKISPQSKRSPQQSTQSTSIQRSINASNLDLTTPNNDNDDVIADIETPISRKSTNIAGDNISSIEKSVDNIDRKYQESISSSSETTPRSAVKPTDLDGISQKIQRESDIPIIDNRLDQTISQNNQDSDQISIVENFTDIETKSDTDFTETNKVSSSNLSSNLSSDRVIISIDKNHQEIQREIAPFSPHKINDNSDEVNITEEVTVSENINKNTYDSLLDNDVVKGEDRQISNNLSRTDSDFIQNQQSQTIQKQAEIADLKILNNDRSDVKLTRESQTSLLSNSDQRIDISTDFQNSILDSKKIESDRPSNEIQRQIQESLDIANINQTKNHSFESITSISNLASNNLEENQTLDSQSLQSSDFNLDDSLSKDGTKDIDITATLSRESKELIQRDLDVSSNQVKTESQFQDSLQVLNTENSLSIDRIDDDSITSKNYLDIQRKTDSIEDNFTTSIDNRFQDFDNDVIRQDQISQNVDNSISRQIEWKNLESNDSINSPIDSKPILDLSNENIQKSSNDISTSNQTDDSMVDTSKSLSSQSASLSSQDISISSDITQDIKKEFIRSEVATSTTNNRNLDVQSAIAMFGINDHMTVANVANNDVIDISERSTGEIQRDFDISDINNSHEFSISTNINNADIKDFNLNLSQNIENNFSPDKTIQRYPDKAILFANQSELTINNPEIDLSSNFSRDLIQESNLSSLDNNLDNIVSLKSNHQDIQKSSKLEDENIEFPRNNLAEDYNHATQEQLNQSINSINREFDASTYSADTYSAVQINDEQNNYSTLNQLSSQNQTIPTIQEIKSQEIKRKIEMTLPEQNINIPNSSNELSQTVDIAEKNFSNNTNLVQEFNPLKPIDADNAISPIIQMTSNIDSDQPRVLMQLKNVISDEDSLNNTAQTIQTKLDLSNSDLSVDLNVDSANTNNNDFDKLSNITDQSITNKEVRKINIYENNNNLNTTNKNDISNIAHIVNNSLVQNKSQAMPDTSKIISSSDSNYIREPNAISSLLELDITQQSAEMDSDRQATILPQSATQSTEAGTQQEIIQNEPANLSNQIAQDIPQTVIQMMTDSTATSDLTLPTVLQNLGQTEPLGNFSSIINHQLNIQSNNQLDQRLDNHSTNNLPPRSLQTQTGSTNLDSINNLSSTSSTSSTIQPKFDQGNQTDHKQEFDSLGWSNIAELLAKLPPAKTSSNSSANSLNQKAVNSSDRSQLSASSSNNQNSQNNQTTIQRSLDDHSRNISLNKEDLDLYITPTGLQKGNPNKLSNSQTNVIQRTIDRQQESSNLPEAHVSVNTNNEDNQDNANFEENINALAQEIYVLLRQRLAIEKERRGNRYQGRLPW